MKRLRIYLFLFVLASALGMTSTLQAGELDDIYRLADEKKLDQAMRKLESFLKEHPKDAQARFLQGLIYTGKSRNDDAIRVFQELGSEFPDLPEPFNNLAVLYAERGEYEKSRQALVNAIRILPDYATAHENLGDIYAKLASQSYAQALRISGSNSFIFSKLELLKKLFVLPNTPPGVGGSKTARASAEQDAYDEPSSSEDEPSSSEEVYAKPAEEIHVADSTAHEPELSEPSSIPESVSESVPESVPEESVSKPSSVAISEPPTVDASELPSVRKAGLSKDIVREDVERTVHAWAQAWSARKASDYLSFYSENFKFPSKFSDRAAWKEQRRRILKKTSNIRVTLTGLKVEELGGGRVRVTFTQDYWSPRYKDQVKKTLEMKEERGSWKIMREYT